MFLSDILEAKFLTDGILHGSKNELHKQIGLLSDTDEINITRMVPH